MSIFNKKSKFKVEQQVRRVVEARPTPSPNRQRLSANGGARASSASGSRAASGTPRASPRPGLSITARVSSASPHPYPSSADERSSVSGRKRKAPLSNSRSPVGTRLSDDSDSEDDDWEQSIDARKRIKRANGAATVLDPNRKLRHPRLWAGDDSNVRILPIIHGADVASLKLKCSPVLGLTADQVAVELQYPGSKFPERYELVYGNDKIDAVNDIMTTVNYIASNYLTDEEADPFLDPNGGIFRQLERSRNLKDGKAFKAALRSYNQRLLSLQKAGTIAKNLDSMRRVPQELVHFILSQTYDRAVSPKVDILKDYPPGSDYIYGELTSMFISDILVEKVKMTSGQVFVDLGSGVGNVVLQAALEIGCESWGCEFMPNPCNLAEAQLREFSARCRLWGLAPGKVHLERGDFTKNQNILEVLKRADVVLVNNQVFGPETNVLLAQMFLDCKVGCKIVSLKRFGFEQGHAENSVINLLGVENFTYPAGYVSWTDQPGSFCISTKKEHS